MFQQWHCNNHVQQIGQVIAVGNEAVWVGEWSASCGGNQVHGYISNVAVREGDAWRVRISTFNVTPPSPPAQTNASPTAAQEQKTVDPEVRQQIESVSIKFQEAYNKYDPAAIAALYTEDGAEFRAWWPSVVAMASGRQAIEKRFSGELAQRPATMANELVQVFAIGNDICAIMDMSVGTWKGHAVLIYVRQADTWKIRVAYLNGSSGT